MIIIFCVLCNLISCDVKKNVVRNTVYVFISKTDCINCRININALLEFIGRYDTNLKIVNKSCRVLELKSLEKELSVNKVYCLADLPSEIDASVFDVSSVGVYLNDDLKYAVDLRSLNFDSLGMELDKYSSLSIK